ncbi:Regulatory protein, TfoX family OS=Xanthomonas translucens DAR61454 GN=A989_19173 PE=4 SV=1: TfoX_C [Gemmataceae bacterium]|nr:Regulatory protein, TfoX family OS=Xanthomonas translucens DAR61454 GN=A989_19173 PE=4 SV=1: TfoX_C [Gemmataceae bacterium]VTT99534.1 Regulatory protein, TfoX family OS=Xanthomonas translucens DAR61454 GN=A989_19173 PE=4 SV=1: TfoX_C [Gemmataceae bacterium]
MDIERVPNLGPVSAGWLREAGITTLSELELVGAVAAYLAVRQAGHATSLNLLWALAAALAGCRWDSLSSEEKRQLREELAAAER